MRFNSGFGGNLKDLSASLIANEYFKRWQTNVKVLCPIRRILNRLCLRLNCEFWDSNAIQASAHAYKFKYWVRYV